MMTKDFVRKALYLKQRARAQLIFKISCVLLAGMCVLTAVSTIQAVQKRDLQKQTDHLIEVVERQQRELNEDKPEVQAASSQKTLVETTYIGDYTITYYCSCEKCCGKHGVNRPVVNNKEVVFTSTGAYAQEGITIAVDPKKIPYGSLLYIEGIGYRIAQDCGGAIKGNRIDVYMDSHQEALQGGRHESKVYIITTGGTTYEQK